MPNAMLDFADPTLGDLSVSPDLFQPLDLKPTPNSLIGRGGVNLGLVAQLESGNRNVPNYKYGPGFTAGGYWQITDTNWNHYAPQVGIDTSQFPNAMSASRDDQQKVAQQMATESGYAPWAPYNPALARAVNWTGPSRGLGFDKNALLQPLQPPAQPQSQQTQKLDSLLSSGSAGSSVDESPWTRLLALSAALQGAKVQPVQVKYNPGLGVVAQPQPMQPTRLGAHTGSLPDLPYTTRVGMRSFWQD